MLQMRTMLEVADNSGAKRLSMILRELVRPGRVFGAASICQRRTRELDSSLLGMPSARPSTSQLRSVPPAAGRQPPAAMQ